MNYSDPKIYTDSADSKESRIYPYYAGYARKFAIDTLKSLSLPRHSIILDPWNGSGTTTAAAASMGYPAIGIDLNPVMSVIAKANCFAWTEHEAVDQIISRLIQSSTAHVGLLNDEDPLLVWLTPKSAAFVRALSSNIHALENIESKISAEDFSNTSPLQSFLWVALFRCIRKLLADFIPSNPTWVKSPSCKSQRKRPSDLRIASTFHEEVLILRSAKRSAKFTSNHLEYIEIKIGNSEKLAIKDETIDLVLTSPPYCTRIDYAVATSIELAILGIGRKQYNDLRRSLMGTSSIRAEIPRPQQVWGDICINFLDELYNHSSIASKTYYYKNHLQYFSSLSNSISEISRVLRVGGECVLVVQDSYYKDLHNDVPAMVVQMCQNNHLRFIRQQSFVKKSSMATRNPRAKAYHKKRTTTETVLAFKKSK